MLLSESNYDSIMARALIDFDFLTILFIIIYEYVGDVFQNSR